MKKIVSLISIVLVFALLCAAVTGCNNNSSDNGTTTGSADTSASTAGTTDTSAATNGTNDTTNTTGTTTGTTTGKITSSTTTTNKANTTNNTTNTTSTSSTTTVTPKNITIFLDPGHGGSDPGTVRTYEGVTYEEADINLAVALKAKAELEKRGYTVIMSRDTDKAVDVNNRDDMAQNVKANMFISIHVNAYGTGPNDVAGPRMYYAERDGLTYDARKFATYFAEEFDDIRDVPLSTDPEKLAYPHMKLASVKSEKEVNKGGYAVLSAKEIPSVLIEMGFITNDNDITMLKSQWWQNYVAAAIADAVDRAN